MTGAMYAAIGGLKSHMNKLNVIGHNIANVNTAGYKTQRMLFQETIYTTSRSGDNGGVTSGGVNPSQIGYGSAVGSIDINMATSTYNPTGVDLDCMIMGEGFFMVGDKNVTVNGWEDLTKLDLTRVGDFGFDANGYLTDGAGNIVYGFASVQNPNYNPEAGDDVILADPTVLDKTIISTELVPLRLPIAAVAPTEDNEGLNDDGTTLWDEGDAVYPVLGPASEEDGEFSARRNVSLVDVMENPNELPDGDDYFTTSPAIPNMEVSDSGDVGKCVQLESIGIGPTGAISGINKATGKNVIIGYVAIASPDNPSGVTHIGGPYYKAQGGAGDLRVSCLGGVLDGKYLNNMVVDGENQPAVNNSILDGGTAEIKNGGLEASSTDIANEFAEMITTQRGYQANTRIITVTDSMLEELVNMKR